MDVDSVIEPLRQIVPTLLDVPFTADEVTPRPAAEDVDQLAETLQQDASKSAADLTEDAHRVVTPFSTDTRQEDADVDSSAVDSVNKLELSVDPAEPITDTVSIPNVTSESLTGEADIAADVLDQEET